MTVLLAILLLAIQLVRCTRRQESPVTRLLPMILWLTTAILVTEGMSPLLITGADYLQQHLLRPHKAVTSSQSSDKDQVTYLAPIDSFALSANYDVKNDHIAEVYLTLQPNPAQQQHLQRRFYLRSLAFETFTHNRWSRKLTPEKRREAPDSEAPIRFTTPATNALHYSIRVRRHSALNLPYVPALNSINLPALIEQPNGILSTPDIPEHPFLNYDAISSPASYLRPLPDNLTSTSIPSAQYLQLPTRPVIRKVRDLAREITGETTAPVIIIERLLDHLHTTCRYSLTVTNSESRDPVDNFLFHEQQGHCELFATSFALLLRAQGIPCRLASGYSGGEYHRSRNQLIFFRDDAHTWVEVFSDKYGWTIVDPSPTASDAPTAPLSIQNSRELTPQTTTHAQGFFIRSIHRAISPPVPLIVGFIGFIAVVILLLVVQLRSEHTTRHDPLSANVAPPSFLRAFLNHFARRGYAIRRGQTFHCYVEHLKTIGAIGDEYDTLVDYVYNISYRGQKRSRKAERQFVNQIHHQQH